MGTAARLPGQSFDVTLLDFSCVHVLIWGPSNVPVPVPSAFLQELPAHMDCQKLGLRGLHCSSSKGKEASLDSKVSFSCEYIGKHIDWVPLHFILSEVSISVKNYIPHLFADFLALARRR